MASKLPVEAEAIPTYAEVVATPIEPGPALKPPPVQTKVILTRSKAVTTAIEPDSTLKSPCVKVEAISTDAEAVTTATEPDPALKSPHVEAEVILTDSKAVTTAIEPDSTLKSPCVKVEAISTDAEAVTPATEPDSASKSPLVESPSSDPFAAQISLVDAVRTGHKAEQERIRKDLRDLKYPEAYACSDNRSKSDVESAVIERMLEREKEDGAPGSLVVKDNGRFRIRSRVYPSPHDDDNKDCSTIWIHVTKLESKRRKMKIIALSDLPHCQEDGWQEWFCDRVSTDEGTGGDQHNVSTVGDTNAPNGPKKDTL